MILSVMQFSHLCLSYLRVKAEVPPIPYRTQQQPYFYTTRQKHLFSMQQESEPNDFSDKIKLIFKPNVDFYFSTVGGILKENGVKYCNNPSYLFDSFYLSSFVAVQHQLLISEWACFVFFSFCPDLLGSVFHITLQSGGWAHLGSKGRGKTFSSRIHFLLDCEMLRRVLYASLSSCSLIQSLKSS